MSGSFKIKYELIKRQGRDNWEGKTYEYRVKLNGGLVRNSAEGVTGLRGWCEEEGYKSFRLDRILSMEAV